MTAAAQPFADFYSALGGSPGLKVFPLAPGSKVPPAGSHGFKDASADPAQLTAWAEVMPDANIGHCPDDSGHWVLDVDPKNGGNDALAVLEIENDVLPQTYTVQTPSGGRHYWFKGRVRASASKIAPGLDVRGQASYVVLPGSVTPQGAYSVAADVPAVEAPAWLFERANRPRTHAQAAPAEIDQDTPANLARAIAFLKTHKPALEGEGGDAHTFATAATLRDLGCSEERALELLWEHWNPRCAPPWDHDELTVKVANAFAYASNEAGAYAVGDSSKVFGAVLAKLTPEPDAPRGRVVLRDEAAQDSRQPVTWLVERLLPDGGTTAIRAPFNSYKSFVASDLALAVASGSPAFGSLKVHRSGPVIYMMGEGLAGFETQRRPAWRKAREIAPERRLPIYTVEGVPQVRSDEDVTEYLAAVVALGVRPGLIIIDTAARSMTGLNENEAGDAGRYLNMVELMQRQFRCAVLTIMHEGKVAERGARGSSAFEAGFENVWKVEADTDAFTARITSVKLKDDADQDGIHLQGRQVAVSGGKSSLVFDLIAGDEHRFNTRKNSDKRFTRTTVGAALRNLGAIEPQTVTTSILASELAGPEADVNSLVAVQRGLQRHAKKHLDGFVSYLGRGAHDPSLWSLPAAANGGQDNA